MCIGEVGAQCDSFAWEFQHHPLRKQLFLHWMNLTTLPKSQLDHLFLDSWFCSLGLYVYPISVLHCLYYCSFVVVLTSGSMSPWTLFYIFTVVLSTLGTFVILYEFDGWLFYFYKKKKKLLDFDTNYIDSMDHFG